MVQQIETIARTLEREIPSEFSKAVIRAVKRSRKKGDAPEVIEGVLFDRSLEEKRMYSNSDFDYDRLSMTLVFKTGPRSGEKISLTPKLNEYLMVFVEKQNENISKNKLCKIFSAKWDSVKKNVSRLRRELELDPKNPKFIVTVSEVDGGGYRFADTSLTKVQEKTSSN